MKNTLVRKTKWFWPWQDQEEEAWLEEMSRQGLHLQHTDLFAQYQFTQGQPAEYIYRLDFQDSLKPKNQDEYLRLFRDDGWEHLGQMGGWQYFRKSPGADGEREIFTDSDSKIQKYNRFLTWFGLAFPSYLVIFVALWGSWPEWMMWLNVGVILLLAGFWGFVLVQVSRRIPRHRRQLPAHQANYRSGRKTGFAPASWGAQARPQLGALHAILEQQRGGQPARTAPVRSPRVRRSGGESRAAGHLSR